MCSCLPDVCGCKQQQWTCLHDLGPSPTNGRTAPAPPYSCFSTHSDPIRSETGNNSSPLLSLTTYLLTHVPSTPLPHLLVHLLSPPLLDYSLTHSSFLTDSCISTPLPPHSINQSPPSAPLLTHLGRDGGDFDKLECGFRRCEAEQEGEHLRGAEGQCRAERQGTSAGNHFISPLRMSKRRNRGLVGTLRRGTSRREST